MTKCIRKNSLLLFIFLLFCSCATKTAISTGESLPQLLTFRFYDVPELGEMGPKWGDCTYISFPNGENMLIDTGTRAAGVHIAADLQKQGIDKIDHLVISHMHSDHYGGVPEIIRTVKVGKVYSNGFATVSEGQVYETIALAGIPHVKITAGDSLQLGEVRIDVLYPPEDLVEEKPIGAANIWTNAVNDRSLVMKFTYGKNTALFTGDLYRRGERMLMENVDAEVLDCDLLKVMHHGHDTSGDPDFIKAVSPRYAVMMGNIIMNKPIYKRYTDAGCTAYASWMNGNVYISFDGQNITVNADNPDIKEFYR